MEHPEPSSVQRRADKIDRSIVARITIMSRHIILGDVHIGKSLQIGKVGIGSALNSRISDQLNLLRWTLDQAILYQAESIKITGDIFEDPKPHPTLIKLFLDWLKTCRDESISVDIIQGNHDIIRSGQFIQSALDIIAEA